MELSAIERDLEEAIVSCGCRLYDIALLKENENLVLRISIMKDGGVSLDDCALVSESISPLLDVKDVIKDAYMLEVSSPGIERALKNPRHFMLSCGEVVQVRLQGDYVQNLRGNNVAQELSGKLLRADERGIWLDVDGLESGLGEFDREDLGQGDLGNFGMLDSSGSSSALESGLDITNGSFFPYQAIKRAKTIFIDTPSLHKPSRQK